MCCKADVWVTRGFRYLMTEFLKLRKSLFTRLLIASADAYAMRRGAVNRIPPMNASCTLLDIWQQTFLLGHPRRIQGHMHLQLQIFVLLLDIEFWSPVSSPVNTCPVLIRRQKKGKRLHQREFLLLPSELILQPPQKNNEHVVSPSC